ncbi:MAG: HAMP domain-containing sensor histidine kinase [Bacteroidota bacterium]
MKQHNTKLKVTGLVIILITVGLLAYFPTQEYRKAQAEFYNQTSVNARAALQDEDDYFADSLKHRFEQQMLDLDKTQYTYYSAGNLPIPTDFDRVYIGDNHPDYTLTSDSITKLESYLAIGNRVKSVDLAEYIDYPLLVTGDGVNDPFMTPPFPGFVVTNEYDDNFFLMLTAEVDSPNTHEVRYSIMRLFQYYSDKAIESKSPIYETYPYGFYQYPSMGCFYFTSFFEEYQRELGISSGYSSYKIEVENIDSVETGWLDESKFALLLPDTYNGWERPRPKREVLIIEFANFSQAILWGMRNLFGVCALVIVLMITLFVVMYRNLRQQQVLTQAREDFIDNMTHELQTPIATLLAIHEGFEKYGVLENTEETVNYLTTAGQQVRRLSRLADAVVGALQREEVLTCDIDRISLHEWMDEQVQEYRSRKEIALKGEPVPEHAAMMADIQMLRQTMDILLDNAIKYKNSEVVQVQLSAVEEENAWQLRITDDGPGIPTAHREDVFEKFYRVSSAGDHSVKGYGIGLYYARQAVERMKGTLTVEDAQPQGACFVITLPKYDDEA